MEVHRALIGLNHNIHKSESRFIIDCIYQRLHGEEFNSIDNGDDSSKAGYVTKEEFDETIAHLKEDILKELNASLMALTIKLASTNVQMMEPIVNEKKNENITVINEVQVTDDIDDSVLEMALDYDD